MAIQRAIKQVSYAGGCLFFVVVLLVGGWVLLARPRLPDVTLTSSPTPVVYQTPVVEQADVVRHGATVDVVMRVRNPNAQAGVADLPLTITLSDAAGETIATHVEQAYLLPGGLQYVVAVGVPVSRPVATAAVVLPTELSFTTLPATLAVPSFSVFTRERTQRTIGGQALEEVKGVVTNQSAFSFERVEVVAVAVAADGRVVGAGKTFVGRFEVSEQREFTTQWPVARETGDRVVALASANIFREESIVPIIGDPTRLR